VKKTEMIFGRRIRTSRYAGSIGCYKRKRENHSLELVNPERELRTKINA